VTYVIVSDANVELVATVLQVDLGQSEDPDSIFEHDYAAYALAAVPGGVVAMESSGYADPSNSTLRLLSSEGRRAAVVRSNIQRERFGCASNGELIFESDDFTYVDNLVPVPAELRTLFGQVWDNLEDDDFEPDVEPLAVAMAMAEVITGITITAEDLVRAAAAGYYRAPSLVYRSDA
jgi:hypothetical protein